MLIEEIIYDVPDILRVNKKHANNRNVGIGYDHDSNKVVIVDLNTSDIIREKILTSEGLLKNIETLCLEEFGEFSYEEEVMEEYLIRYTIPEEVMV